MKARKGGAILAAFVALFLLFYGSSDVALLALRRVGPAAALESRFGSGPSPFTNPALAVKETEADLPLGVGSLRLGDLVRMLNTMDSNLEVKAFYGSFMSKPSLRAALKQYMKDKDGRALQRTLVGDREFAALFELYSRSDRFQYRLAMLNQPPQTAAPKSESAAFAARTQAPTSVRAEPAPAIGHPAAGPALAGPDGAVESGYRSGPGYDGQPQPGLVGADEAPPLLSINTVLPATPPGGIVAAAPPVSAPAAGVLQGSAESSQRALLPAPAGGSLSSNSGSSGSGSGSGGSTPCWPPGHCKRDSGGEQGNQGRD